MSEKDVSKSDYTSHKEDPGIEPRRESVALNIVHNPLQASNVADNFIIRG